jgi:hypothetical protein
MDEVIYAQFLLHIQLKIKEEDNLELNKTVTKEEIFAVINQLNPNKSPSTDGFTIKFYKICWSIIKFDFIRMILLGAG